MPVLNLAWWDMPELRPLACHHVEAVMLFPGSPVRRKRYILVQAIKLFSEDAARREALWQHLFAPAGDPSEVLRALADGMLGESLSDAIKHASYAGAVAGQILAGCFFGASVRQMIAVLTTHRNEICGWAKEPLSRSRSTVKKVWQDAKPVAHLWAAIALSTSAQDILMFADLEYAFTFTVRTHLPGFLSRAEGLRHWAETCKPHAQCSPMLQPDQAWTVPPTFSLPPSSDTGLPPLAYATRVTLESYQAK